MLHNSTFALSSIGKCIMAWGTIYLALISVIVIFPSISDGLAEKEDAVAAFSVESGFSSLSPNGASGGAIIPASCESGYTHEVRILFSNGAADSCARSALTFWADSYAVPPGGSTPLHWLIYTAPNPENGTAGDWVYRQPETAEVQGCTAYGAWDGDKTSQMYPIYANWSYTMSYDVMEGLFYEFPTFEGTSTVPSLTGLHHADPYALAGDDTSGALASTQTFYLECDIRFYRDNKTGRARKSVTIDVGNAGVGSGPYTCNLSHQCVSDPNGNLSTCTEPCDTGNGNNNGSGPYTCNLSHQCVSDPNGNLSTCTEPCNSRFCTPSPSNFCKVIGNDPTDIINRDSCGVDSIVKHCPYGCTGGECKPTPAITVNTHLRILPSLLRSGDTTKLYWGVSNADSCTVTGSNGDGTASSATGAWNTLSSDKDGVAYRTSSQITGQTTYTLNCLSLQREDGTRADGLHETQTVNIIPVFCEPGLSGC